LDDPAECLLYTAGHKIVHLSQSAMQNLASPAHPIMFATRNFLDAIGVSELASED